MAATVVLSATSLEGQVWEAVNQLQQAELAQPEADRPNRVTIGVDTEGKTITAIITFDATTTVSNGQLVVAPVPYLP